MTRPIFLFTDYGWAGFYVGQLHASILPYRDAGSTGAVIDLMHDVPAHDVKAASYLLAALAEHTPENAIIVGVVDPGVGGDRPAVALEVDNRIFVGPGNGLFEIAKRRASDVTGHLLTWRPKSLSASFHGRDLFAPAAAKIATAGNDWREGLSKPLPQSSPFPGADWPDDLPSVIHIDGFGNAMTGIRAAKLPSGLTVAVNGRKIQKAITFSDLPKGDVFWYENSIGLVEIAVNQGQAAEFLRLEIGSAIGLI